jgi:hypothetical protein
MTKMISFDEYFDPQFLILYKHLMTNASSKPSPKDVTDVTVDLETSFMLQAADIYNNCGQPSLSLYLLKTWYTIVTGLQETKQLQVKTIVDTGTFDFDDWGFGSTTKQTKISLFDDEPLSLSTKKEPEKVELKNDVLNDYKFKFCIKLAQVRLYLSIYKDMRLI